MAQKSRGGNDQDQENQVLEGEFVTLDQEGNVAPTIDVERMDNGEGRRGVANDNHKTYNSIDEALSIPAYEDLDEEQQARVDEIIDTIDVYDLNSIFTFGDEVIKRQNDLLDQIEDAQNDHGAFFDRFKSVTEANTEAEEMFRKAVERGQEFFSEVPEQAVGLLGKALSVLSFVTSPLTSRVERHQKEKHLAKMGAGAKKYEKRKAEQNERFLKKHRIAPELEQDILRAATERGKVIKSLEEVLQALPILRESYQGLVNSQRNLHADTENYIIAGRRAIQVIEETHLPKLQETARKSRKMADRNAAEDLQNALDLFKEKVLGVESFRQNAVIDALTFQARAKRLQNTELQLRMQHLKMESMKGSLVKLRIAITGASIEKIIAEARQFENNLALQEINLNDALAEMAENSNDDLQEKVELQRERMESAIRVIRKQAEATQDRRIALEDARNKIEKLNEHAARLALAEGSKDLEAIQKELTAMGGNKPKRLSNSFSQASQGEVNTGNNNKTEPSKKPRLDLTGGVKPKSP